MNYIKSFVKQAFAGVISIAAAAVLIGVLSPKAVHAAVAALVEVANTPSNPVPNTDVSRSAANLIYLYCLPGHDCYQINPGGATNLAVAYTVPAGQNLVVTEVEMLSPATGSPTYFALDGTLYGPTSLRTYFGVPSDGATHAFQPRGVIYPAGSVVPVEGGVNFAYVGGYLTPN